MRSTARSVAGGSALASDTPSAEDYQCSKCGIEGQWNEDCGLCMATKNVKENSELYEEMGGL